MKRQMSLTKDVLVYFGPTNRFSNTFKRWRNSASQHQIICYAVSVSIMNILQVGSQSNRHIVYRCHLTGACTVKIAAVSLRWCLRKLIISSALFLHGLPMKPLTCLWPGRSLQVQWFCLSVQYFFTSIVKNLSIPRSDSGWSNGLADASLATFSDSSLLKCHSAAASYWG
jgi:hypothetical protein